jgi:hypothetical protein
MREEGDDDKEREQRREKRRHQDEAEESSSIYHSEGGGNGRNTSSKDSEDLQPAKLRSAPAYECLTPRPQNLTPPSATQLEVTSRCDSQLEFQKSSSPSPTGDKEPTSNAGAAYQEWPMRRFFKLITIGNKVHYSRVQLRRCSTALRCNISATYVISRL